MVERRWLTPPQLAKEIGIDPEKVIAWINAGELRAVNIAKNRHGRARWRVLLDDWDKFLDSRANNRTEAKVKTHRKKLTKKDDDPRREALAQKYLP